LSRNRSPSDQDPTWLAPTRCADAVKFSMANMMTFQRRRSISQGASMRYGALQNS